MATQLLAVLVIPALVVALISLIGRLAGIARTHGVERSTRIRSLAATVGTAVAGFAAAVVWAGIGSQPPQDVRLATLPALCAAVAVLAAAVAELTWPQQSGRIRQAGLVARRPASIGLRFLYRSGLVGTALALIVGVVTAAPDGRSVTRTYGDFSSTASPYPGITYAVPVGLAAIVLAAATWWALRRVEQRPALLGDAELDTAVRAQSQVRVLRFAAVGSLMTAAGLWLTLGPAVNRVTQNLRGNAPGAPTSPGDWVQNLGFVGTGLGVVLLVAAVVALVWHSPRLTMTREAGAGAGMPA